MSPAALILQAGQGMFQKFTESNPRNWESAPRPLGVMPTDRIRVFSWGTAPPPRAPSCKAGVQPRPGSDPRDASREAVLVWTRALGPRVDKLPGVQQAGCVLRKQRISESSQRVQYLPILAPRPPVVQG